MRVAGGRAGLALLVAAGCGGSEPTPKVVVMPGAAYNDVPVPLVFAVSPGTFRPAYSVDTTSGETVIDRHAFQIFLSLVAPSSSTTPQPSASARIPVEDVTWKTPLELDGTLRAGLAKGTYDVEVHDPRGNVTISPGGFQSLGPDLDAPAVSFGEPGEESVVAADTTVPLLAQADDGAGHLKSFGLGLLWRGLPVPKQEPCAFQPGASHADCPSGFIAPVPDQLKEELWLTAVAEDTQGNRRERRIRIYVAPRPRVDGLSPTAGASTGATAITVTGENFVTDASDILVDGIPIGARVEGTTRITGLTPIHDPGKVVVAVRTGSAVTEASGLYEYVGQPKIRIIEPSHGPVTGCTRIAIGGDYFRGLPDGGLPFTTIYFGQASGNLALLDPELESENRIVGWTPPGPAVGPITVYASDPVGGVRSEGYTFTYDPVDAGAPGDAGPPPSGGGGGPCPNAGAAP